MGAPVGNVNGLKHGMRSSNAVANVRFNLGKLSIRMKRVEQARDLFRRAIEMTVVEAHGRVGVYHAALIQSAARWEERALLAQRWLRLHAEEISLSEKLACSKAIGEATTARDKCLAGLGLHQTRADAWAELGAQLAIDAAVSEECDNDGKPGTQPGSGDASEPQRTEETTDVHT